LEVLAGVATRLFISLLGVLVDALPQLSAVPHLLGHTGLDLLWLDRYFVGEIGTEPVEKVVEIFV